MVESFHQEFRKSINVLYENYRLSLSLGNEEGARRLNQELYEKTFEYYKIIYDRAAIVNSMIKAAICPETKERLEKINKTLLLSLSRLTKSLEELMSIQWKPKN